MRYVLILSLCGAVVTSCTKDMGINPALAYNDLALLDSCQNPNHVYYQNNQSTILPGNTGHGTFKLRFNSVAKNALSADGKLANGKAFPNGSMIVKDVYKGSQLNLYAYMYKKNGTWLWGEIKPTKEIIFSVNKNSGPCVSCHSQSGNRDLALTFKYY